MFGDMGFQKVPLAPFKDLSVGRRGRSSQKAVSQTQARWWQFASGWWGYGKRLGLGHILKVKSTGFADRLDVGYERKRGVRVDPWCLQGWHCCILGWRRHWEVLYPSFRLLLCLGSRVGARLPCSGEFGRAGAWPSDGAVGRALVDSS